MYGPTTSPSPQFCAETHPRHASPLTNPPFISARTPTDHCLMRQPIPAKHYNAYTPEHGGHKALILELPKIGNASTHIFHSILLNTHHHIRRRLPHTHATIHTRKLNIKQTHALLGISNLLMGTSRKTFPKNTPLHAIRHKIHMGQPTHVRTHPYHTITSSTILSKATQGGLP